jgi:D-alanyl-D-alanine carboxypeptidase (penicillin-binding protein 5/6)
MNARAGELGMSNTQFVDPSGVSPRTTSTPEDLIHLAQEAMNDPVFVEIVSQAEATLPVAGRVQNVNAVLGQDGIVGIKTGWTPEAGGCFLFVARYQIGGHQADVVGAVLGQADHEEAFARSRDLTRTVRDGLQVVRVWSRNQVVTNINPSWSGPVAVVAADDLEMLGWPGVVVDHDLHVEPSSAPIEAGAQVGWDTVQLGDQVETVDLATTAPIEPPGLSWRLFRPL